MHDRQQPVATRRWADAATQAALPTATRLVVVAPHPDDETLGAGGAIARWADAGGLTLVVSMTDGEACFGEADADIAAIRRRELTAALGILDPRASWVHAGLPDGGLAHHVAEMESMLDQLIDADDLVLAPWRLDWHPDHEALGEVTRRVCRQRGATLWSTLFWGLHHRVPDDLDAHEHLVALTLTTSEAQRRQAAWKAHGSQQRRMRPVVAPADTAHLSTRSELYVVTVDDPGADR